MTVRRRLALAVAFALLAAVSIPAGALAHARYKSSTPGTGEVVQTSPAQVSITFTQEVQKVSGTYGIDVTNASGAPVTAGTAVIDDQDRTKMSVALKPNLPPGRYLVSWKNVSDADGDPFNAAFAFYVASQPSPDDRTADAGLATAAAPPPETPSPSAGTVTPAGGGAPTAAATLTSTNSGSSGGSSNTALYIGLAAVGVVVIALGAGWVYVRRR